MMAQVTPVRVEGGEQRWKTDLRVRNAVDMDHTVPCRLAVHRNAHKILVDPDQCCWQHVQVLCQAHCLHAVVLMLLLSDRAPQLRGSMCLLSALAILSLMLPPLSRHTPA